MALTPEQIKSFREKYNVQPVEKKPAGQFKDYADFAADINLKLGRQKAMEENVKKVEEGKKRNILQKFGDVSGKVLGVGADFMTGAVKGIGSTLKGASSVGEKMLQAPLKAVGVDFDEQTSAEQLIPESLTTPSGTAQKIGFGAEQIAEYFVPASKIAKAEKAVNLITRGMPKLAGALTRIGTKGAISGLSTGLIRSAQTGDIKEGAKTGLISGGIRGGMATIGEGAKALHIPERLYQMVFKNSKQDMLKELKSGGLQTLQQKNPQKFQEFVDSGIIKTSKDGTPILNDTLAEKALDMGLKGSIRNMSDEVVEGALDSEQKVRQMAAKFGGKVDVSEPQIKNVIQNIADDFKDVGFGEISQQADDLINQISAGNGKVSAGTAVDIKRLLDKARISRSFDVPITKLSQSQANLKTIADTVRNRVNKIPEMGETMKNYSFYIDALETLANEAKRRGNNQVLSLIDSLFISSGLSSESMLPVLTAGGARKLLQSPWALTTLGQKINQSNISPMTSGLISNVGAGLSEISQ